MREIRNWSRFQHFKDRKPPWVKLYRDLLDDINWHELDGDAAKMLIMLFLIASEHDGNLPSDKELAFRLRIPLEAVTASVSRLGGWLIHDDITPISHGYQSDIRVILLTRSRETEIEKEAEAEAEAETHHAHEVATGTTPGKICKVIRSHGIADGNPGNPLFLRLIEAGANEDEFASAAQAAKAAGKSFFAYVLGIVKNQRAELASLNLHQGALPTAGGTRMTKAQADRDAAARSLGFNGGNRPVEREIEIEGGSYAIE